MGEGQFRLWIDLYSYSYVLFDLYIYTVFHYMFLSVTINFITLCYVAGNHSEV